jgi:hypothetical protein
MDRDALGRGNTAPITAHLIALADGFATWLARTDHGVDSLAH